MLYTICICVIFFHVLEIPAVIFLIFSSKKASLNVVTGRFLADYVLEKIVKIPSSKGKPFATE